MNSRSIIILILCAFSTSLWSQLPKTEIFHFNFESTGKKKKWTISNPKLLTFDNKNGYNNQPSFIGDEIYITQSSYSNGGDQTDIVALNVNNKTKSRVTQTGDNEYSPTAHPDGQSFSVIKQYKDGRQHLVKYAMDRKGKGKILFSKHSNIGYHCWLTSTKVALFLVDEAKGHRLVIGDTQTGAIKHVAFNVGRCLKKSPNGNLIYLDKEIEGNWRLKTLKPETGQTILLGQTLTDEEDFEVLPNGYIITGHMGNIYRLEPENGSEWVPIVSLKSFIKNKKISRIAVKDNQLALVVE